MGKLKGIIPAFYACYDMDGNVCVDTTKRLVRYFINKGVDGLYVCGSSGECIYLSKCERRITLEAVMEEAKGEIKIIAHVACNNTKDSMELAAHAESLNVDYIAAIPPIYFKLPEVSIAKYWNDISSAAPNSEFMIYNIPQLAGVSLTSSLFRLMLENDKVSAVKNSSMALLDIQTYKSIAGSDFSVFNGPDEQLLGGLAIGADGGIGGTYGVMCELYIGLYKAFNDRDLVLANNIQSDCLDIINVIVSAKGNMYAIIKEVIKRRTGIDCGGVRLPLLGVYDSDESIIVRVIDMIDSALFKYKL